jgi:hypothetical protein
MAADQKYTQNFGGKRSRKVDNWKRGIEDRIILKLVLGKLAMIM